MCAEISQAVNNGSGVGLVVVVGGAVGAREGNEGGRGFPAVKA